ncbi:hypothetical protein O7623_16415 [Solwaraspora sp. WMMD791]|nr:hypothetical protein [Solwaraspora sp. WMMD791]WFE25007.1 hypothetical protein O7623_16415 [Solwaraspora sp. WMMD791]
MGGIVRRLVLAIDGPGDDGHRDGPGTDDHRDGPDVGDRRQQAGAH